MTAVASAAGLDAYPDGAAVLTADGTVRAANERCARLCGRSREQLRGERLSALTPDDWAPAVPIDALADRAQDGRETFTWRIDRPDGGTTELDCAIRRTDSEASDPVAILTVRRATATAERGDGDLRALLDGLADPAVVLDGTGAYLAVNRAAADTFGYDRATLRARGPAAIEPPGGDRSIVDRVDGEGSVRFETERTTASGDTLPVEVRARRTTYRGDRVVVAVLRDVRDRRARRRRLRTFQRAVEQAGHAVYITAPDGTIEYVNPAFERLTGYDADEAVGRTPAILSSGAHDDDYYERLWATILDGEVWEETVRNERADGSDYYAEQTIAPVDRDGDLVNFVAIQHDITERKRREAELERYRQLIENIPVGVYRTTPGLDGEFEAVNPAMVEMFDADDEAELLDTPVAELYRTPAQRELLDRQLASDGRIVEAERRLETLDGDAFWGAISVIRHEVDGEVYYDGIVQDITERRDQARELRIRERRFRRLFEDHDTPMLLVDPETGGIERANDAAVSFYGYARTTLESLSMDDLTHAADGRGWDAETDQPITPHELADGTVRQVEVDSSPVSSGGDRFLFCILHDVTERERTRRRLERQTQQLELLNRVVCHDIRNDMTVVIGRAELLAEHVDGRGRQCLDTLTEHAEHVVELTRTARELTGTMLDDDDGSDHVSLRTVLSTQIDDLRSGYEHADVTVADPLPDCRVRGNEMLGSVFRNLLTNAVQHNDADEPSVTVSVAVEPETVRVDIADDGPGVPDERKAEIFGKGEFGMGSSGTGIGLYLVHTFVDQFGGEVWVTDNKPEGAVFHVALPRE